MSSLTRLRSVLLHEVGHALGLDHSQIGAEARSQTPTASSPVMFPRLHDSVIWDELRPDDIAAISLAYPSPAFDGVFGHVSGEIRFNGELLSGVNVVAEATGAGGGEGETLRYASVSGYSGQADGVFDLALLPGEYSIRLEKITPGFDGWSSVGPYATNSSDTSFRVMVPDQALGTIVVRAGQRVVVSYEIAGQ